MINFAYAIPAKAGEAASRSESVLGGFIDSFWFWIAAIVVFIFSFFIASLVKKIVITRIAKKDYHQEVLILVGRMSYFVTLCIGIIIAFKIVGIDLASVFGFIGIGVGFALKDLLSNFIAGIMILTQKQIKIGDVIAVDGKMGKIITIDGRTTQIKGFDGIQYVVPNSKMTNLTVDNFSNNTFRRVEFVVGVEYDTNLPQAVEIAKKTVLSLPLTVETPEPQILVSEFGDSKINIIVRFWVTTSDYTPLIKSEAIQKIKITFDASKIKIPFPIQTMIVKNEKPHPVNVEKPSSIKTSS